MDCRGFGSLLRSFWVLTWAKSIEKKSSTCIKKKRLLLCSEDCMAGEADSETVYHFWLVQC